jgi:hypothetical protein
MQQEQLELFNGSDYEPCRDSVRLSATPETKAFKTLIRGIDGAKHWVPAGFAEILERERDKARRERDEAMRQLDNLKASSIHSCHDQCQRPMCVLRRERDELKMQLKVMHAEQIPYFSDIEERIEAMNQRLREP